MNTKILHDRIAVFENRLNTERMTASARTSMRRSISQCKRRLSEFTANGGMLPEPPQLQAARLATAAQRISNDLDLLAKIDDARRKVQARLDAETAMRDLSEFELMDPAKTDFLD